MSVLISSGASGVGRKAIGVLALCITALLSALFTSPASANGSIKVVSSVEKNSVGLFPKPLPGGLWRIITFQVTGTDAERSLTPPFSLHLIRLPDGVQFGIELSDQDPAPISIKSLANDAFEKRDSIFYFSFSGGFLETINPPTPAGYVQIDGEKVNGFKDSTSDQVLSGFLCVQEERLLIGTMDQASTIRSSAGRSSDCIQAGPVFVDSGKSSVRLSGSNTTFKRFVKGYYRRSFLAADVEGNVFVGITTATALDDLAIALTDAANELGVAFDKAIHLHGSRQAAVMFGSPIGGTQAAEIGETSSSLATFVTGKIPID